MTRMQKNELYDELSRVLTDYETQDEEGFVVDEEDLYKMLVKIQNNWEELTGDDE